MTQNSNSIDQIAAWAGALEAGQVPPAAVALAKKAFLDTLAVSLSGSQLDSARIVTRAGARARPRRRPLLGDRPWLQGGRARRGARQRHGRPCRAVRRQQRADDVASQRVAGVGPAAARAIARPRRRGGAAGLRRGLRGQCRAGTPAQSPHVRGGLARDAHPGRPRRHRRVLPAAEARAAALSRGPGHRRLDGERPAAELRHHDDGPARRPHRARRRPCRAAGGEGLPVGQRRARRQVRLLQSVRRRAARRRCRWASRSSSSSRASSSSPIPRARRPMRRSMPRSPCMASSATACTRSRASSAWSIPGTS